MRSRVVASLVALSVAHTCLAGEIVENKSYTGVKTTIRYAMWGGADEVDTARDVGTEFVKGHPEIRLDISVYPWGQYWAKVQTQMASGLAPDVLSFYSGAFGIWAARGALLPLNDLAKDLNPADYHQVAFQNCTWDGKLFTMPMEMPEWTLVYSKDRLEQSGIPRSEWPKSDEPMTWDQFQALAKRLTLRSPDGKFAQYGMSAGQNWDMAMMSMMGGFITDRQVDPRSPASRESEAKLLQGWIELFKSQYADRWTLGMVPITSGAFQANSDTLLLSPLFAMGTTGPWALRQLKDGGARFGVSPMPRGPFPIQLINVNSVGIYAFSKHPKESYELIRFMAGPFVQNLYGRHLKGIPVLKSAGQSLIHNDYGIDGLEAYLHDLDIAKPALTSDSTDLQNAVEKWRGQVEPLLDAEYDRRTALLKKPISKAENDAFVAGMNAFIEKTTTKSFADLQSRVDQIFVDMKRPPPTPFERVGAPILIVVILGLIIGLYVRGVSRSNSADADSSGRHDRVGYLFIAPWLVGFACFLVGPILAATVLSFTDWNMISAPHWVGSQHYADLPTDSKFLIGLKTTFLYAALVIPISLVGGLATAGLLTSRIKGSDFFKAIIYFPSLFTGAEAAVLWVNMLNKEYGVLNYVLSWVGIAPINWLDEQHAFYSVILMNAFWIGGAMIIYYAGMKQIPATLYEAAELDGASGSRRFLRITIPLLSPVILFMIVMTTIGAFQVFTPALFFASDSTQIGTPGDALRFYSVNIYDTAFNNLQMGSACAYALVLFLLIFVITMIQMRLAKRFVHTEGM